MANGEAMITLRELSLEFEPDLIEGVLITGDWMDEHEEAKSLIQTTEEYCQQLIEQTQRDIEDMQNKSNDEHRQRLAEMLEEMEANFLDKTNGLFADWYAQRERDTDEITGRAKQLVERVFLTMIDQLPDEDKLHAVFRQIVRASDKRVDATLYSNPKHIQELTQWIHAHPELNWALVPDDDIPPEELGLRTVNGELSLSWEGFKKHIITRLL